MMHRRVSTLPPPPHLPSHSLSAKSRFRTARRAASAARSLRPSRGAENGSERGVQKTGHVRGAENWPSSKDRGARTERHSGPATLAARRPASPSSHSWAFCPLALRRWCRPPPHPRSQSPPRQPPQPPPAASRPRRLLRPSAAHPLSSPVRSMVAIPALSSLAACPCSRFIHKLQTRMM